MLHGARRKEGKFPRIKNKEEAKNQSGEGGLRLWQSGCPRDLFLVETGYRSWTCRRWEDETEMTAHLGFFQRYGSWGSFCLLSKWDGKCMVCSVLDENQTKPQKQTNKKQLPRELLTTVCLLISSGFKFILAMWSRKPHNERGMQSSLWLVLPCLYHSEWGSPRSLFLLTLSLLFEKILHLQGFKCMFHWPEWFVRHLSSPSCKSHGRVFLAGHSAEGIILDSANKKEGGMDLDRRPALSATRCKG